MDQSAEFMGSPTSFGTRGDQAQGISIYHSCRERKPDFAKLNYAQSRHGTTTVTTVTIDIGDKKSVTVDGLFPVEGEAGTTWSPLALRLRT